MDLGRLNMRRAANVLGSAACAERRVPEALRDKILHGDCLATLRQVPDCSIDFAFADPPYNLAKKYLGYSDDLAIQDYFRWCDRWIAEMARVLKPGRTLAVLNIPLWAVRHFLFLRTVLEYQNWIVWDALAFPVRRVMPAHYAIVCFSKGPPRGLPGLTGESRHVRVAGAPKTFDALAPLAEGYCLRQGCVDRRIASKTNDRSLLTDVWCDIHRLKHNSRRVDHPCQLPPHLMYRLITLFTKPGETVMDCFNGAGTTTLAAHQLGRNYIGMDSSEQYCALARHRHLEIENRLDPFRKAERKLTSKNSPVRRLPKQEYKVSKKTLQLEVKRVAAQLGHIPTREELLRLGKYPIDYYDRYFISWGEVTAAARTTGMSEVRGKPGGRVEAVQLRLVE
jgi:site-specific DNA-methyltransferase (adenine-specific)